jgi:hypothetical protein
MNEASETNAADIGLLKSLVLDKKYPKINVNQTPINPIVAALIDKNAVDRISDALAHPGVNCHSPPFLGSMIPWAQLAI